MIKTDHIKKHLLASENHYVRLIAKLLLFFIILFVLDFGIGSVLRYFYFKQDSGQQYRTTYSLEHTEADLLIFGSSRATHHYYPKSFEDGLNLTCYNTGRDGCFILYNYAILCGVLKRYTPKMVILDINREEFRRDPAEYDRLSSLLPYYRSHPEIRPVVELKGRFEKYKMISQIYPFNSALLTIAIGNFEGNKQRETDINGFVPLSSRFDGAMDTSKKAAYELDTVKIEIYKKFLDACKQAGVKVYVVCSPEFIKEAHLDSSIAVAKALAKKANVSFISYLDDPNFRSNRLFSDIAHLNQTGAIKFSASVIKEMKAISDGQLTQSPGFSNQ